MTSVNRLKLLDRSFIGTNESLKNQLSHTYIFVVVNFDALAQASDIQIERRQVVFLCWMRDLNPGPQTPNRQQTECSLTNRLSYRGSSKNLEFDSPSLWSASIQPTWPHCQLTFAPGSGKSKAQWYTELKYKWNRSIWRRSQNRWSRGIRGRECLPISMLRLCELSRHCLLVPFIGDIQDVRLNSVVRFNFPVCN